MRVGVVEYINTLLLAAGLERFLPEAEITRANPARIAEGLEAGNLDVGLVPVATLAQNPSWEMVPGLGIASDGPVRSVLLLSRVPVRDLRRVTLDPASRTSNLLAQLWLEQELGRRVEVESGPADLAERLDRGEATVAIGDAALLHEGEVAARVDLGSAWTDWTGLPFVYAVWAGPGAGDPLLVRALNRCFRINADRVGVLVSGAYPDDAVRRELAGAYLRENIINELGPREREGLNAFLERARRGGYLPENPKVNTHAD